MERTRASLRLQRSEQSRTDSPRLSHPSLNFKPAEPVNVRLVCELQLRGDDLALQPSSVLLTFVSVPGAARLKSPG